MLLFIDQLLREHCDDILPLTSELYEKFKMRPCFLLKLYNVFIKIIQKHSDTITVINTIMRLLQPKSARVRKRTVKSLSHLSNS